MKKIKSWFVMSDNTPNATNTSEAVSADGSKPIVDSNDRYLLIYDGFSISALLLGPIWLLTKSFKAGLFVLGISALVWGVLSAILHYLMPEFPVSLFVILITNIILAFESGYILEMVYARSNFKDRGVILATDEMSANKVLFDRYLKKPKAHDPSSDIVDIN